MNGRLVRLQLDKGSYITVINNKNKTRKKKKKPNRRYPPIEKNIKVPEVYRRWFKYNRNNQL